MSARAAVAGLAGNRRNVVLGAAVVIALFVALAGARLLGGGSEDPYAGLSTPAPQGATPIVPVPSSPGPAATAPADGHLHDSGTTTLRDPFCPLVVAAATGVAAGNCPQQAPPDPLAPTSPDQPPAAAGGQPMTLVEVFAEGGHLHARVRVGPTDSTLHVNDTFGEYKVASLSDTCGEFIRGGERRRLCQGEQWTGAPSPPATSP